MMAMFDGIIDLSHHNGPSAISGLETAYKSGIRAVIHKATQGTRFGDDQFHAVRDEAKRLGMLFGAYHFGTSEDPIEQAKQFLHFIDDPKDCLLVLDFETNQTASMSALYAAKFVAYVANETGQIPGLYTTAYYMSSFPFPEGASKQSLSKCWLWLARYNAIKEPVVPIGWSDWTLWQYTDASDIPGIGKCDRSRFRGSLDELEQFWKGHTGQSSEPSVPNLSNLGA